MPRVVAGVVVGVLAFGCAGGEAAQETIAHDAVTASETPPRTDAPCRVSSLYEPDFEEMSTTPQGAYQRFRELMLEQIDRVEQDGATGLDWNRVAHMRDGLLALGPEPDSLEVAGSTATVGDRQRLHFTLSEFDGDGWAVTESSQALDPSACE